MVFDGPESPGMATHLGGIEIVWSGNRSADDVISKRIAALGKTAKSWTVITNDQSLTRRCRNHGAKVEPASTFVRRTTQPKAKSRAARSAQAAADKPAPNAKEIAHWRAVFGEKEKTSKGALVRGRDLGGAIRRVELHSYEAHGIGSVEMKIKRYLD